MPAAAHGTTTIDIASGATLDAFYPNPVLAPEPASVEGLLAEPVTDEVRGVRIEPVTTVIEDLDAAPADTADAYLRLHLLSHRLVAPHEVNLDGIFGVLPNVAWTDLGPVAIDQVPAARMRRRAQGGHLQVL